MPKPLDFDRARRIVHGALDNGTSSNQPTRAPTCPKHGEPYVIQSGSNRCPLGRKRKTNCRG